MKVNCDKYTTTSVLRRVYDPLIRVKMKETEPSFVCGNKTTYEKYDSSIQPREQYHSNPERRAQE
jgi:hypothetical protein